MDVAYMEDATECAWVLNIVREHNRNRLSAKEIQRRMDAKFPASEHQALWENLLAAVGAR